MTIRPDGRRVISVTMQPELYDRLMTRLQKLDQPVTAYVRELIRLDLARDDSSDCYRLSDAAWLLMQRSATPPAEHLQ